MSEEFAEEQVVGDSDDFGTGLNLLVIKYDSGNGIPEIDLGGLSPYVAVAMLQSVIDSLECLIPAPRVVYRGQTVFDPNFMPEDVEAEPDELD